MLLWIFIFSAILLAGAAGIAYLMHSIHRFRLISLISEKSRILSWLTSGLAVLLPSVLLGLLLGYMNAIVIVLHLVIFWVVSDIICFIIRKLRKKPFKRYYAGASAIVLTTVYLSAGWILAHKVQETDYTIKTSKAVGELRIALIADSHLGTTFHADGFAEYLRQIQEQNPDIIVLSGDFVDEDTDKEDMEASCHALGEVNVPYGVYYVFGNHDKGNYSNGKRGYDADDLRAELEQNGVTVLEDESVLIDNRFYLVGRQDASEETDFGGTRSSMNSLTKTLDKNIYTIVLDHQPRDYSNQAKSGVDLVLSGHTHGGQMIPLMQLMNWFGIGGNDSVYGLKKTDNTNFIVTSGISDWAIKFKTGCISEYVIIDVRQQS